MRTAVEFKRGAPGKTARVQDQVPRPIRLRARLQALRQRGRDALLEIVQFRRDRKRTLGPLLDGAQGGADVERIVNAAQGTVQGRIGPAGVDAPARALMPGERTD